MLTRWRSGKKGSEQKKADTWTSTCLPPSSENECCAQQYPCSLERTARNYDKTCESTTREKQEIPHNLRMKCTPHMSIASKVTNDKNKKHLCAAKTRRKVRLIANRSHPKWPRNEDALRHKGFGDAIQSVGDQASLVIDQKRNAGTMASSVALIAGPCCLTDRTGLLSFHHDKAFRTELLPP